MYTHMYMCTHMLLVDNRTCTCILVLSLQAILESLPALGITSYSPSHMIRLEPPLVLHNHLPIPLSIVLQAAPTRSTQPSETFTLDPSEDELIIQYHWKGEVVIRIKVHIHVYVYCVHIIGVHLYNVYILHNITDVHDCTHVLYMYILTYVYILLVYICTVYKLYILHTCVSPMYLHVHVMYVCVFIMYMYSLITMDSHGKVTVVLRCLYQWCHLLQWKDLMGMERVSERWYVICLFIYLFVCLVVAFCFCQ